MIVLVETLTGVAESIMFYMIYGALFEKKERLTIVFLNSDVYLFFVDIVILLSCLLFYIISSLLSTFLVYIHALYAQFFRTFHDESVDITSFVPSSKVTRAESINPP